MTIDWNERAKAEQGKDKDAMRKQIAEDTEKFLAAGGQITVLEPFKSKKDLLIVPEPSMFSMMFSHSNN